MSGRGDPGSTITATLNGSVVVSESEPASPTLNTLWWSTADRQWFQWSGVTWVPQNVVPEAPLGDGPYGRDNADWTSLFSGFRRVVAVDTLPAHQELGVLYLVKGQ